MLHPITWVTHLLAAIWSVSNDYSWYITDPAANFALVQANCGLPTLRCVREAKVIHTQAVAENLEHYWCEVGEEKGKPRKLTINKSRLTTSKPEGSTTTR